MVVSLRHLGASRGNNDRLLLTLELLGSGGVSLVIDSAIEIVFDVFLASTADGGGTHIERLSDLLILKAFRGFEQDPGAGSFASRGFSLADQVAKKSLFVGFQCHPIFCSFL